MRGLVDDDGALDRIDRERAQRLALVAEGVEVPVVAVVDEALRRDLALERVAVLATRVAELEAAACEQRGREHAEVAGLDRAGAHAEHADPVGDVVGGVLARFEQFLESLAQRRHQFRQHARLQVGDQLVHRQQRAQLLGVEPQAGQLPERAVLDLVVEAVGLLVTVVEDRGVEAVAQVVEVALERGARDFELLHELLGAHEAARLQQLLDPVEAFEAFHGSASNPGQLVRIQPEAAALRALVDLDRHGA